MISNNKIRCAWTQGNPLLQAYHDQEWGIRNTDDHHLFECLTLEGAQAGLSWLTILKRRQTYRKAYDDFNVSKIAKYDENKIATLLLDPGIIRNKLKVHGSIQNAKMFIALQKEFGSFHLYLKHLFPQPIVSEQRTTMADVPARTSDSDALSKDLKKRGFTFVGSTICYAFMQAVGLVQDHTTDCYLHPIID